MYIYAYILVSSARFANTMAYGTILRDLIAGSDYRIIHCDDIMESYNGLHYVIILWNHTMESYHRKILWTYITE